MKADMIKFTIEQYFVFSCLFWCMHRILIEGFKIALGYYEARFNKTLFEIPEIFLCGRCLTFWFVLVMTFNPVSAAAIAVFVHLIESVFVYLGINTSIK